jgi:hypothetical protein
MATLVTATIPGATSEMYDSIKEAMGLSAGNLPVGLLSHHAAFTDEGLLLFDVWESREKFEDFAAERLGPAMEQVTGGTGSGIRPVVAELHDEVSR